jgi:hypothetical protein
VVGVSLSQRAEFAKRAGQRVFAPEFEHEMVLQKLGLQGKDAVTEVDRKTRPLVIEEEFWLEVFLEYWAREHWRHQADGGTGRSGNTLLFARWQGKDALIKMSPDAGTLKGESENLSELADQGVSLRTAKVYTVAQVKHEDTEWMAYLMEWVGQRSLRDHLFEVSCDPAGYIKPLAIGLKQLYLNTASSRGQSFVYFFVSQAHEAVKKLSSYGSFSPHAAKFDLGFYVNGELVERPLTLLSQWAKGLENKDSELGALLRTLEPAKECRVHGDLHFENIRIDPAAKPEVAYWLIDPKNFQRHDYVYDIAKLLTSLCGHGHADVFDLGRGNVELEWTGWQDHNLTFNCFVNKRQCEGWKSAFKEIESLAKDVASGLEADSGHAVRRMKQRLLLALARHFFSAPRYFMNERAQWMLFARGAQFLSLFQRSLQGEAPKEWDPFEVCPKWLETR